jgi:cytochrome P450
MLVARGLAPEDAELLRPRIQEIAREILDAAMSKGTGDFVSEIALRLPSGLIAELMGIPREDSDHRSLRSGTILTRVTRLEACRCAPSIPRCSIPP